MNDFLKKLDNFWYYNKVYVLIGIIGICLVGMTIKEKMSEVKYDNTIAIVSLNNYPNEKNIEKLKNIFIDKLDGTVDVVIYNVELGSVGQDQNIISKLDLDLANKISKYFFIEDFETFKKVTADIEFQEVTLVSDVDWLSNLGLDNFTYAIRK